MNEGVFLNKGVLEDLCSCLQFRSTGSKWQQTTGLVHDIFPQNHIPIISEGTRRKMSAFRPMVASSCSAFCLSPPSFA